MTNQGFGKIGYYTLDRVTDVIPSFAPKVFQKIFLAICGSALCYWLYLKKYQHQLLRTKSFDRILIVVDINIGDAVLLQNSIEALRVNFPDAQIDYMCSKKGGELIFDLQMADNVYNVFNGGGIPSAEDVNTVKGIITANDYSLILNLSPFVSKKMLNYGANIIQLYIPFSVYILYLWRIRAEEMHISNIAYSFLCSFLKPVAAKSKKEITAVSTLPSARGNTVYLSHNAIIKAAEFLESNNIYSIDRLLLFNPDVTIKYSMIPFNAQVLVLKNILESGEADHVLIAKAYVYKGIELKLLESMPEHLREKIVIVPYMPLDVYTALIDICDVFLTGDTGPLHIAASWKEPLDEHDVMRNRTAVVSVIGPTDSRMFCYDSEKPGHMPAFQDAPSKVFAANSPCRNVTCLNKTGKTCNEIRCFDNIDPVEISNYIVSYFHYLRVPVRMLG